MAFDDQPKKPNMGRFQAHNRNERLVAEKGLPVAQLRQWGDISLDVICLKQAKIYVENTRDPF